MAEKIKKVASPVVGADDITATLRKINLSSGNMHSNEYPPTKTSGIKIRGTGAATKGTTARGPMA